MKNVNTKPLSPYGQFIMESKGYKFFHKGRQVDKWEVFELGFRDFDQILRGNTIIVPMFDVDYQAEMNITNGTI